MDGRTDIWSLGSTIYEMLTGTRPFVDNSTQVLMGIHKRHVAPLRSVNTTISVDVEAICQKCRE